MLIQPREIRRSVNAEGMGTGLHVRWSDGVVSQLLGEQLRRNCPCASCREARGEGSHDAPLSPAKKKPSSLAVVQHSLSEELSLVEVWPVGNYAIGIRWGDGHATGIFTFEFLRSLTINKPDQDGV